MVAVEHRFGKVYELISEIEELVEEKAHSKERADRVERMILDYVLQLGHAFLDEFFRQAGDGDVGETTERDGKTLKRIESKERSYHSIFGIVKVRRFIYAVREKKRSFAPLDADLAFPKKGHSYVLQDLLGRFIVKDAFDGGVASLRTVLGLKVSKRTAEQLNEDLGGYVDSFRASRPMDYADDKEILAVSADGKGVPIRSTLEERNNLPETPSQRFHRRKQEKKAAGRAKRRRARGQVKVRKQMAYVGAIYSIEPQVRTRQEVLEEAVMKTLADRPRPCNKRVQAVMTNYLEGERINGQEVLFADLATQVKQRDPKSEKTLVCLMDGQRSLWDQQCEYLPRAIPIIDVFHVSERLWEAAYCFHKQSSRAAEKLVCRYFEMLLDGKVDSVIRSLRAKKSPRGKTKKKTLQQAITYLENNRQYMQYDEYLSKGYPIGSGVVEGTCRHLVKDRLERTGMRWEIEGAQAMLNTRSAFINDEWDDLIEYRIQEEQKLLYGQAA